MTWMLAMSRNTTWHTYTHTHTRNLSHSLPLFTPCVVWCVVWYLFVLGCVFESHAVQCCIGHGIDLGPTVQHYQLLTTPTHHIHTTRQDPVSRSCLCVLERECEWVCPYLPSMPM